jgi:hypothetical protein
MFASGQSKEIDSFKKVQFCHLKLGQTSPHTIGLTLEKRDNL